MACYSLAYTKNETNRTLRLRTAILAKTKRTSLMYRLLLIPFYFVSFLPQGDKELVSRRSETKIFIDGVLNEWKGCPSVIIRDKFRKKSTNNLSIQTMWNKQYLYIAFNVADSNLQAKQTVPDHPELYLDDMVEFLLDTKNDKDSCWDADDIVYHINLLSQKKDDRGGNDCKTNATWNGRAKYAVKLNGTLNDTTDIDGGYTVEVAIWWRELGIKPAVGVRMGVNFANGDNGKLFDWVGASPFRSPFMFGDLVLN